MRDSDLSEVVQMFEGNIHPLNDIAYQKLLDLYDEYHKEPVLKAIKVAAENNARSVNYIARCLENWKNGKDFARKQEQKAAPPPSPVYVSVPDDYDPLTYGKTPEEIAEMERKAREFAAEMMRKRAEVAT